MPTAPAASARSGVTRQLDVGKQLDTLAVERHGRRMAQTRKTRSLQLALPLAEPVLLEHDRRWVDHDDAAIAIDDHPVVLANQTAGFASADHRGYVHAARHDGGVGGAPADVGDEPGEHAALELQHVGGRDVVGDKHERVFAGEVSRTDGRGKRRRGVSTAALATNAPPPARGRPCARAGIRPPSRRTGEPAPRAGQTLPIPRCSGARESSARAAPVSASSCSSIRWTSSSALNSGGASCGKSRCRTDNSPTTASRAASSRSDLSIDARSINEIVRHVDAT